MSDGAALSETKRTLLARYLRGDPPPAAGARTIPRRPTDGPAPLSFAQQQLWLFAQLVPDVPVYNEPITIRMMGPLDEEALERSFGEVIRRHEAWRTTFSTLDGQPIQVIHPPSSSYRLPVVDLHRLPPAERRMEALRLATEEARRPFDLARDPLVRATLMRLGPAEHHLYVTLHHIIMDGVTIYKVLLPELRALYEAFSAGRPSPLPELAIQYADYACWQREQWRDEAAATHLAYWRTQLGGPLPSLQLPTGRSRPAERGFSGTQQRLALSGDLSEAIKALSRREQVTPFIMLLAAFKALLHRYSGQDDILVSTVTAGRKRPETETMLGFFLNSLVLRTDVSGHPSFRELLRRVRQTSVEAYRHDDVPFELVVKALQHKGELSNSPLFQVGFALEPVLPSLAPGWTLSQMDVDTGAAKRDLYLELDDRPEGIIGRIQYNTELFDDDTIARMRGHLRTILEGIVADPDRPLSALPMVTEEERRHLSAQGNRVRPAAAAFVEFTRDQVEQTIPRRFAAQVQAHPARLAVETQRHRWSYRDLNREANRVARAILAAPGAGEERVALLFEHDAPMIAGLLGALKAGKTYVPLDPGYPQARLAYMLDDAQVGAIVTNQANRALAAALAGGALPIVSIDHADAGGDVEEINRAHAPDGLAYILYTSGSTGRPKGTMQNHRNVLHFIAAYTNNLRLGAADRLTLLPSYSFDAAVMDIFGALLNGASLHPWSVKAAGLAGLGPWLVERGITIFHSTPTVYRHFVEALQGEESFPALRLVVLGGEEVRRRDVELYKRHFAPHCILVNGLGPTESTVSLQYFVDRQTEVAGHGVPVGYAVQDTEVLLLNEAGPVTMIHGLGEIAIRSPHLALGYWRRPEQTAAVFLADPDGGSRRIYRSGDLGRLLPDGAIEYMGRKDFQVKIRGHRVEVGEIETKLLELGSIKEAVVVAREDTPGDRRLVAYLTPQQATHPDDGTVRRLLGQHLPEYMVPSALMWLDRLPLTASGKLDRRALPAPGPAVEPAEEGFVPPELTVQHQLAAIWEELLEVRPIGITDDFFELGGHSLLAARLIQRIEQVCGRRLPLAALYRGATIEHLGRMLLQDEQRRDHSRLVQIQAGGDQVPFFFLHGDYLGGGFYCLGLARALGPDRPFYALQPHGMDGDRVPYTVEAMAAALLVPLRAERPHGPYVLGGYCAAGYIALEMARQLRAAGERVDLLVLLDTALQAPHRRLLRAVIGRYGPLAGLDPAERVELFLRLRDAHAQATAVLRAARSEQASTPAQIRAVARLLLAGRVPAAGAPGRPPSTRQARERGADLAGRYAWATAGYRLRPYAGQVALFWSEGRARAALQDPSLGWSRFVPDPEVHLTPGTHLTSVTRHVEVLAGHLRTCLARAQAGEPRARPPDLDRAQPA